MKAPKSSTELIDVLQRQKTLPTLIPTQPAVTLEDIAQYQKAGHGMVEILLRTPFALETIRVARKQFPGLLIGAGTVLTPLQVEAAAQAGAQFIVSPAMDVVVGEAANLHRLPFIPGVCTPTDVAVALRRGFVLQKLFPVELHALEKLLPEGTTYLDALNSPYGHTPLRLIAAYGVTQANFASHLSHRLVAGVIAGWLHDLHGEGLEKVLRETLALSVPAEAVR
ncbi:MAG: eda 1 [Verrucomicrobia bacterium]|nr:eda 1 [Verrucomicrobiota bacterium]